MRKLATLTAAAALLAAGGLLLAPNPAWADPDVTILGCIKAVVNTENVWVVAACDSTDVTKCNDGDAPYDSVSVPASFCTAALIDLIVEEGYGGGRKTYQFAPVGDGDEIIYTFTRGSD